MKLEESKKMFDQAFARASGDVATWWPSTQLAFTLLAWRVALTFDKKLHPKACKYVCVAKGKSPEEKKGLLDLFAYAPWDERSATCNRHINYEFIVDFSVYIDTEDPKKQLPVLTMESEMAARYDVTHVVDKANGYSWDYSKLLWCPSRARLFMARVGRRGECSMQERRDELWTTLASLADLYKRIWSGPLIVFILGSTKKDRPLSEVGVWRSGAFQRAALFP